MDYIKVNEKEDQAYARKSIGLPPARGKSYAEYLIDEERRSIDRLKNYKLNKKL